WQTALFTLLALPVTAAAAWQAYCTAGVCDRGGGASLALGVMVLARAVWIGGLVVAMVGALSSSTSLHEPRLDPAGNVLRITWTLDGRDRTTIVTDVEGHVIPEYEGVDIDDTSADSSDRFPRFGAGMIDEHSVEMPPTVQAMMHSYRTASPGIVGLR